MEEKVSYTGSDIVSKYFADFTNKQSEQINALYPQYLEWNSKINVISRKDMDNFYLHHVLHSLSMAAAFNFNSHMQVMDLGCGGGFPGIPLAIFFPETEFLLVDSINKKLTVVKEIADAIGLQNVQTRHARAEDIKDRKFDVVVSRAVAPLGSLWQWSRPLLKKSATQDEQSPNGLICLKGGDLTQEIFESGIKPFSWEVFEFFPEQYFKEKYMLYQPFKK